jgi:uncharacterized protein YwgA
MKKIILMCVINLLLSCNKHSDSITEALNQAGDNKEELQKVMSFYKKKQ